MTLAADRIRLVMALRRAGITDMRVLAAIERIPREVFLHPRFQDQAYDDLALPIGHGQTISRPSVVARMSEALQLTDRDKVLEIGTGSGYQTAVLTRLARRVYTIERHDGLQREALSCLAALRLHNVTARVGDGHQGWPEQAPFSHILVTAAAAADHFPSILADQLKVGGVMVLPVAGDGRDGAILRLRRNAAGWTEEVLDLARFVPLVSEAMEAEPEQEPTPLANPGAVA